MFTQYLPNYHKKSDAARLFISLRKQALRGSPDKYGHSHIRIDTLIIQIANIHNTCFPFINKADTVSVIACLTSVPAPSLHDHSRFEKHNNNKKRQDLSVLPHSNILNSYP